MSRALAMFNVYRSIIRCESAIAAGSEAWPSIAKLMVPCYRAQLIALAAGLSRDEQFDFERMVLELDSTGGD